MEAALKAANIANQGTFLDPNSVKVRFADTDTQLKAKDVLSQSLNPERDDPSYVVALNLLSRSPQLAHRDRTRCPCTSAWTCAAACTSCCRWT